MKILSKKRQRGFIKIIILIIVALLALKYVFGINLKDILDSKFFKDAWSIIKSLWALLLEAIKLTIDFAKVVLVKAKEFFAGFKK